MCGGMVVAGLSGSTNMFGEQMQDVLRQTPDDVEDEKPRELTVEEALELAIQLQRQEEFAGADAVFRGILKVDPQNARALHLAGGLAHQMGRSPDGGRLL